MSQAIYARILYDEIRMMDPKSGLYVWCDPDEAGVLEVQRILHGAPFKVENSTEYHVTVLYHEGKMPERIQIPVDRPTSARLAGFEVWPTEKGNVMVLRLDSPELQELHAELLRTGLTHSFPDFKAHLTVAKNVDMNDRKTLGWYLSRNHYLKYCPTHITLDERVKASSLA